MSHQPHTKIDLPAGGYDLSYLHSVLAEWQFP